MSYFKYGDVVRYTQARMRDRDEEWTIISVKPSSIKDLITVTNQREMFSCDEEFLVLIHPTPEERAREKLGEDYL